MSARRMAGLVIAGLVGGCLLVVPAGNTGAAPAPAIPPLLPEPGVVTAAGEPVPGLTVQLWRWVGAQPFLLGSTATDAAGEYTFAADDCGHVQVVDPGGVYGAVASSWCPADAPVRPIEVAPGGTLSGTVVAEDTGLPLTDACIDILNLYGHIEVAQAGCTDSLGQFTTVPLPQGFHVPQARPAATSPYRTVQLGGLAGGAQWSVNVIDQAAVPVVPGADTTVAFVVPLGSVASGTVTYEESGEPAAGAIVTVDGRLTVAGADGAYTIGGLAVPWAFVRAHAVDSLHAAGVLEVKSEAGDVSHGADLQIALTGTLTGTVTDDLGAPVVGACVLARPPQALPITGEVAALRLVGDAQVACTDGTGTYSITGLRGGQQLRVTAPDGSALSAWAVVSSGATTAKDIALPRAVTISGTVIDSDTGDPLGAGIVRGDYPHQVSVAANGTFTLGANLRAGEQLGWAPSISPWADKALPPYFSVGTYTSSAEPGDVVSGVELLVRRGGTVSGVVTGAGGVPVEGAEVTGNCSDGRTVRTTTGPDGSYSLDGVFGTVAVSAWPPFDAPAGYAVTTSTDSRLDAVEALEIVANVDISLSPASLVRGTVTHEPTGLAVPTLVTVLDATTLAEVALTSANEDGQYTATVPPGTYLVRAEGWMGYPATYSPSASAGGGATAVTVASGQVAAADITIGGLAAAAVVGLPSPLRMVDTRPSKRGVIEQPGGSVGGDVSAALQPGATRRYVLGSQGGLPPTATLLALNVTAVAPAAKGYLTVYPCASLATPPPPTSTLNVVAGVTVANNTVLPLAGTGGVCLRSSVAMHAVLDVTAYGTHGYAPATAPTRLFDSRPGQLGTLEQPDGSIGSDITAPVAMDEHPLLALQPRAGVPTSWMPLVVTVTVVNPAAGGFLMMGDCESGYPRQTSVLNYRAGVTTANTVLVKPWSLCVRASTPTHVIIDLLGGFETGGSQMEPRRLVDSRPGEEGDLEGLYTTLGSDLNQPLQPGVPQRFVVADAGYMPLQPGVVALNAVAVAPSAAGYLTVYPCDSLATPVPATSTLNFPAGSTVANGVLVQPGLGGGVCVVSNVSTHLILDLRDLFRAGVEPPT